MLVVADTSALVALAACDGLGLLDALFEDVLVPRAVWRECSVEGKPFAARLAEYLQLRVVDVSLAEDPAGAMGLGRGVARRDGLNVIGSIGVLLGGKAQGLVDAIKPYLDQVQSAGIHLGRGLVDEALRLAGEV